MEKEKTKLTKVAKGIAFGDVSNQAVRNILTEISKKCYEEFTTENLEKTMEYFDWCCPYTGEYLKDEYDKRTGNYATDHIYPQNRIWCGLNVMGNLVLVNKKANSKKRDQSVVDFLENDTEVLGLLDDNIRKDRLEKIKKFQAENGYNPILIRDKISDLMQKRYAEVRKEQEGCIEKALDILSIIGVFPTNKGDSVESEKSTPKVSMNNDFVKYLVEMCGRTKKTANSYNSGINSIMKELSIDSIAELEAKVENAINYCSEELDKAKKAGNVNKGKYFSNSRSALRKYKEFIDMKKAIF